MKHIESISRSSIAYFLVRTSASYSRATRSVAEQQKRIETYAKERNLSLRPLPIRPGASLADALDEFCAAAIAGRAKSSPPILFLTSIDRLSRDGLLDNIARLLNLLEAGIEVHIVDDRRKFNSTNLKQSVRTIVDIVFDYPGISLF